MKITYNWLREYVNFDYDPDQLVKHLTMLGLEVDSHAPEELSLDGVVIGEVVSKEAHSDADRLSVCSVDLGHEITRIVCGAPNVAVGQKVPVATVGAKLPGGLEIKRSKIRGVESAGMICSEAELGLADSSIGIMVLDPQCESGTPFQTLLGESDYLIDIDVTPNRPDCFGMFGIARDVAALGGTSFELPATEVVEQEKLAGEQIAVMIADEVKCPRYTARYIENVKIRKSPLWLVRRLRQLGIRPINNIVDVTNYIMMETGQPLHAFDYDLLEDQRITVRTARDGEKFETLDGKTHTLNSEALLICDGKKPVALAGIMGGQNSEVSEKTVNVLLESAHFDATNIRRTSKALGITTESSKRFERGVDPNRTDYVVDRAARLIAEVSGGKIAKGVVDAHPSPHTPMIVKLRPSRVSLLLGVEVPRERIVEILTCLGFEVKSDGNLEVSVPSYRPDVTREADLIEEIGRVYGYDNIPVNTSAAVEQATKAEKMEGCEAEVKNLLLSFGFSEVVTYNLIASKTASLFKEDSEHVKLVNPLSEDLCTLRPNLIASLMHSVRWNLNRGIKNLKLFEVGNVFSSNPGQRPKETSKVSGICLGKHQQLSWRGEDQKIDFFDIKGVVEYLLARLKISNLRFENRTDVVMTEICLAIKSQEVELGYCGELAPKVGEHFDVDQKVFFFELDMFKLLDVRQVDAGFKPIPRYPALGRDLAIVVSEEVLAQEVLDEVRAAGGTLLKGIELFDVFRGDQVGAGKKSLALNLSFLSLERTLKEKEVDRQMSNIMDNLSRKFSAQLRS